MRLKEQLSKAFHEKGAIQRFVARKFLFGFFERFGFHLTGDHFYEIVPNTKLVTQSYSNNQRTLDGIEWAYPEAEQRIARLIETYGTEYQAAVAAYGFQDNNPYFAGLDPLILYCFLRDSRPKKMVEVGQGFSTLVTFAALERNAQDHERSVEFISIDPYSRMAGNKKPANIQFKQVQTELQKVNFDPLLDNCDFLFVDSSHVYKFGSDVAWEFTYLYPRLKPGTTLHLHDIYSPYNYPLNFIADLKLFWNEQYFLEVFLMFNQTFEVKLPVQMLVRQSQAMATAVGKLNLDPSFEYRGSSMYVQRRQLSPISTSTQ